MYATNRGKQKQQAEVSEEGDFETFVRESLRQLSKGQKQITDVFCVWVQWGQNYSEYRVFTSI